MDRREFLRDAASTLLVLPFGTFLIRCTSTSPEPTGPTTATAPTQPDDTPPDAPPHIEDGKIVYTSNKVNLHSHSFAVPVDALKSPPDVGVAGDTTSAQGHSHSIVITKDALKTAGNGQPVKVQTATAAGHSHTFTIVKV